MGMDLALFDTDYTADCFETVPSYGLVTIGTYQYFPEEQRRKGRLYLMQYEDRGALMEKQRIDGEGILDMRWAASELTCALANGTLQRYTLGDDSLLHTSDTIVIDEAAIVLSLDTTLDGGHFCSTNLGEVALVSPGGEVESWKAHACEVWCGAADRHDPHLLYTGSDDYSFALWDSRSGMKLSRRVKHHSAGVCSLASSPHREHHFVSGSYDETCAFWDARNTSAPLSTHPAGSGVWRLKWHPQIDGRLLAACMHDGFHVWDIDSESQFTPISKRPTASIAYGCDWILGGPQDLCGGATFYNHEAIVWRP